MRKTIKLMSGVLALAMCFSAMPMSAFAAQEDPNNQWVAVGETPEAVEVEISVVSKYSVKIPKKLTIEGVAATTDAVIPYTYMVSGSIAGNEQLSIVPDATITMQQEGKADKTGTITQEKQVWSCAEFEALNAENPAQTALSDPQNGKIHVMNMSAGTWNGTFNFNIALENANLFTFYIDDTPYQAEKDMTWGQWIESEYNTDGCTIKETVIDEFDSRYEIMDNHGGIVYAYNGGDVVPGTVIDPTNTYYTG